MWKNLALIAYTLIICVFGVLWLTDKITWTGDNMKENTMQKLEKASEILKPQVLELKDVQLLCIPSYKVDGINYQFNYHFYVYENGTLKSIDYANK
jgi:hypothetical protein